MTNWNDTIQQMNSEAKETRANAPVENKPVYTVADIIIKALAENGIDADTVVGKDSIQFDIRHEGRKIHFFMQYDEDE
jgi:hypothetical protein